MSNQIQYRYGKIDIEQFAMFDENYNESDSDVQIQTDAQFAFDKDSSVLCSIIIVNLFYPEKPLIKAVLKSYFAIKPESIDHLRSNGKIFFPRELLVQFASLCYGTLRGVIYAKTKDTPLSKFILPPIYFNEVIDKEFVVDD